MVAVPDFGATAERAFVLLRKEGPADGDVVDGWALPEDDVKCQDGFSRRHASGLAEDIPEVKRAGEGHPDRERLGFIHHFHRDLIPRDRKCAACVHVLPAVVGGQVSGEDFARAALLLDHVVQQLAVHRSRQPVPLPLAEQALFV